MSILRKSNKKSSSRRQISIKGAKEGILMLPNNEYRLVLEASPVNFELRSEDEQDALIDTYESFLNSLPCPLQIVVRIRELEMDKYLSDIQGLLVNEKEEIYRSQLHHYSEFVQSLVVDNKILSRHFFIILPYTSRDGADFSTAKEQLVINSDMVNKGLMRMGMQTRQLDSLEILDLFYSFYNPGQAKHQPIAEKVLRLLNSSYTKGTR